MKNILATLILFLAVGFQTFAQQKPTEDVVYLKNGSIVRGQILSHEIGKSLKVQIIGGSIFVYQTSEVEKIVKEEKYAIPGAYSPQYGGGKPIPRDAPWHQPYLYKTKGFSVYADLSFQFGRHPVRNQSASLFVSAHAVAGYHITPKDFVGFGSGIEGYFQSTLVPFQLQYRRFLKTEKPVQPYLYAGAGYASAFLSEDDTDDGWNAGYRNKKGGFMANLGTGLKFNSRSGLAYTIGLGYRYQKMSMEARGRAGWIDPRNPPQPNPWIPLDFNFGRADITFGIAF